MWLRVSGPTVIFLLHAYNHSKHEYIGGQVIQTWEHVLNRWHALDFEQYISQVYMKNNNRHSFFNAFSLYDSYR